MTEGPEPNTPLFYNPDGDCSSCPFRLTLGACRAAQTTLLISCMPSASYSLTSRDGAFTHVGAVWMHPRDLRAVNPSNP